MRVIFSPASPGADLLRQVGTCRACKQRNIAWIVRGHVVTMALLACEYCRSGEVTTKKQRAADVGIEWRQGSDACHGKVVGKNLPEKVRPGDLVM